MSKIMRNIIYKQLSKEHSLNFAQYMNTVLYNETAGYYATKKNILGHSGDFYTSAHAGSIFGAALAETYLKEVFAKNLCRVLEYGAGDGRVANSFLDYLAQTNPQAYEKTLFYIVEISAGLRQAQADSLHKHLNKIKWIGDISEIAPFNGMIYCNEFLDALPVHVLKYQKEKILELYLSLENNKLVNKYQALSPEVHEYSGFLPKLPPASKIEFSVNGLKWLRQIYKGSDKVFIYIIDYGYTLEQKITPQRRRKLTIRCFKEHQVFSNPFAEMGERDITADVDFSTIEKFAESLGFKKDYFLTQSKFILKSGLLEKLLAGTKDFVGDEALEKKIRNIKQLVFPGAMGEAFSVLKLYKE